MSTDAIDRVRLATGLSWVLAGIAVVVLDVRLAAFGVTSTGVAAVDILFDPIGAVAVAVGVERVIASTPRSSLAQPLRILVWLHVVLVAGTELGILLGALAVGGAGVADVADATVAWQVVAAATGVTTAIGVVTFAQHLRRVLTGVAADRWRQVTIAWVATVVALPLLLLTGALELVVLGLAIAAIAGVLLLVALFATRRAAEEDILDRDFER